MSDRAFRISYVQSRPAPRREPSSSLREGSWRSAPLPPDWRHIRLARLRLDGFRCTYWILPEGERCEVTGNGHDGRLEVDHVGAPDDHSIERLRSLCVAHHRQRTAAQNAERMRARPRRAREPEPHPGLLHRD